MSIADHLKFQGSSHNLECEEIDNACWLHRTSVFPHLKKRQNKFSCSPQPTNFLQLLSVQSSRIDQHPALHLSSFTNVKKEMKYLAEIELRSKYAYCYDVVGGHSPSVNSLTCSVLGDILYLSQTPRVIVLVKGKLHWPYTEKIDHKTSEKLRVLDLRMRLRKVLVRNSRGKSEGKNRGSPFFSRGLHEGFTRES